VNERFTVFSIEEVQAFGRISGDCNPIHMDPVAARRLSFGGAGAHGMLVVLNAMERLVAEGLPVTALSRLKAVFRQPVLIGMEIAMSVTGNPAQTVMTISSRNGVCATLFFEFKDTQTWGASSSMDRQAPAGNPAPLSAETMSGKRGTVPLGYPKAAFSAAFPALAPVMPDVKVAGLLALTRIVGMECPGERSLFSAFEARWGDAKDDGAVSFQVTRWDDRLNLATIAVQGAGLSAELNALLRPVPVAQPEIGDLRSLVPGKFFAGQRALVVGGSRGLGEACAKLLALGGADHICLTYAAGREDGERVAGALAAYCDVKVTSFNVLTDVPPEGDYTHVYYFAAPRLQQNRSPFNANLYRSYGSYFTEGMAALFQTYSRKSPLRLLQPSSVFVETPEPWFLEYAAAKAASECLGRQLMSQYSPSVILTPRLPRVLTDQTQGLPGCADAAAILMPSLLQLAR
jgi:hypothetical protein